MPPPSKDSLTENSHTFDVKYSEVQREDTAETAVKTEKCCPPSFLKKEAFHIIKPLVPLKMSLFLWYGAGSVIQAYQMVFFKQRGLTIKQLSFINIITPVVQCFGPTISGLVADKLGRSKPVLLANMVLVLIFLNSMMLIPYVTVQGPDQNMKLVECGGNTTAVTSDVVPVDANCTVQCPNNTEFEPFPENVMYYSKSQLLSDVHVTLSDNITTPWCGTIFSEHCNLTCKMSNSENNGEDNTTFVFLLALFLVIFFNTTFSNCYRFMDVTSMSMVKTYNSDFGRERIWCVVATIILTPLSGYLVHKFTLEGGTKNYLVSFYMFDILILIDMLVVMKLEVQIKPPGEMLWKKILKLLRNPDVLVFILSVLILGSSWGFMRVFTTLYLDDLGASSMIYALIPTVSAIVGLPFLITSNWWVEKIGSNNLLIIGFLGYTVKCLGYSFLINPWLALLCEMLAIFTYHLLWVAVVRHSHEVAPEGLTATVISTAGGIHYGLGRGTGSLIGGLIMSKYGGRQAFRAVAIIAVIAAFLLASYAYLRRNWKRRQELKKATSVGVEPRGSNCAANIETAFPLSKQDKRASC